MDASQFLGYGKEPLSLRLSEVPVIGTIVWFCVRMMILLFHEQLFVSSEAGFLPQQTYYIM